MPDLIGRRALPPTSRSDARYCCDACRAQAHRTAARDHVAIVERSTPRSPERRRCEQCGEPVEAVRLWDYRRADARFCSGRCRVAAHRARRRSAPTPTA